MQTREAGGNTGALDHPLPILFDHLRLLTINALVG